MLCSDLARKCCPGLFKTVNKVDPAEENDVADEPNPPQWPASVIVIKPEYSPAHIRNMVEETEDTVIPGGKNLENPDSDDIIFSADRHFVQERYAVLFQPGTYKGIDIEVGIIHRFLGLVQKPTTLCLPSAILDPMFQH
jgi:hypothetical protein